MGGFWVLSLGVIVGCAWVCGFAFVDAFRIVSFGHWGGILDLCYGFGS